MTNQIAIALLLLIGAVFLADQLWLGGSLPLVAAKGVDQFIEYLAFWR
ncbi:hypothetical protein [Paracoccus beibuensis]|nr:hypothetical protein [Paracoccus beibuensis]